MNKEICVLCIDVGNKEKQPISNLNNR